jgi:hypothetical protein
MNRNFKINFRKSRGNLHVNPEGDFDNFPRTYWFICFMNNMKEREKFLSTPVSCAKCALSGAHCLKADLTTKNFLRKGFFLKGKTDLKWLPMEAGSSSFNKNMNAGVKKFAKIANALKEEKQWHK